MKKILFFFLFLTGFIYAQQQKFTVYFDFDKDQPNTIVLKKLNRWINKNKKSEIIDVFGYADTTGYAAYNSDLSQRRADNIVKLLQEKGINVTIVSKSFGETKSGTDRAKDRKVEIYYNNTAGIRFSELVTKAKKGDKLKIPNLNFYNNSDIILPDSQPFLDELLAILQNNPQLKIDIQGHICCQVTEENEISLKRAAATYAFLVKSGIDKNRLSYTSFGSSRPIYPLPEKSEEERIANRRVEIEIIEK